jgi:5-methylcytosine-specific restriction endonuclease McrA
VTGEPSGPLRRQPRSAQVTPLSPGRYKYQLTIGCETLEKLRLAKDMLRHALPSGDDEALLDRALTVLLLELARKKFGAGRRAHSQGRGTGASSQAMVLSDQPPVTCRRVIGTSRDAAPQCSRIETAESRCIPAAVKRAVWLRDLGRCTFVGTDGRRCSERAFLQFHHVHPYAVGGEPTVENIRLRCGPHNRYEARQYFAREPAGAERSAEHIIEDVIEPPVRAVPERTRAAKVRAPGTPRDSEALQIGR